VNLGKFRRISRDIADKFLSNQYNGDKAISELKQQLDEQRDLVKRLVMLKIRTQLPDFNLYD